MTVRIPDLPTLGSPSQFGSYGILHIKITVGTSVTEGFSVGRVEVVCKAASKKKHGKMKPLQSAETPLRNPACSSLGLLEGKATKEEKNRCIASRKCSTVGLT